MNVQHTCDRHCATMWLCCGRIPPWVCLRTCEVAALAGFNNSLTVYNAAASIVDQVCTLLHLANGLLVEHTPAVQTSTLNNAKALTHHAGHMRLDQDQFC